MKECETISNEKQPRKEYDTSLITKKDGSQIYYKEWGQGPAVTFSHGWPLSADAWDGQMAKAVLLAAVPPIMLKSKSNPEGLPIEVFDNLRNSLVQDRSQFYRELATPFYGATGRARMCRKARWISSGSGACRPA